MCQSEPLVLAVIGTERWRWARTVKIKKEVTERPVLDRARPGLREAYALA